MLMTQNIDQTISGLFNALAILVGAFIETGDVDQDGMAMPIFIVTACVGAVGRMNLR
jgi:hypothetical protein